MQRRDPAQSGASRGASRERTGCGEPTALAQSVPRPSVIVRSKPAGIARKAIASPQSAPRRHMVRGGRWRESG